MTIVIQNLIIVTPLFLLLRWIFELSWGYYVPLFSILVLIWLNFIYKRKYDRDARNLVGGKTVFSTLEKDLLLSSPGIFLPGIQFRTSTAWDFAASQGWLQIGLIINSLLSIINFNGVVLVMSVLLLIYTFYGDIASYFVTEDEKKNLMSVALRYERYNLKKPRSERDPYFNQTKPIDIGRTVMYIHQDYCSLLEKLRDMFFKNNS